MEMSLLSNQISVSEDGTQTDAPISVSSSNKRKRGLPGNPDPDAEVIALSPKTLITTNRFICEICNKGFQRDQNLQLHRRGHNLPWKLKQRSKNEIIRKKVYICPEVTCVHHDPSRALGDLTGIKKHFFRKHGEKKWKCEKCSKKYAVQSDWKAHSKVCGTREYKCDCGTIFSRRDSFITHRAFCDALTEEASQATLPKPNPNPNNPTIPTAPIDPQSLLFSHDFSSPLNPNSYMQNQFPHFHSRQNAPNEITIQDQCNMKQEFISPWETMSMPMSVFPGNQNPGILNPAAHLSATALLQKAAQMGATLSIPNFNNGNNNTQMASHTSSTSNINNGSNNMNNGFGGLVSGSRQDQLNEMVNGLNGSDGLTRDFLGLRGPFSHREMLNMAGLDQCMNAASNSFDQTKESWHG
ncbi:hypothetical protein LUZ60_008590 [Juncus effusus]|nr:hypothetical protein LUZ60_008590 [Juncus effusus]